MTLEELQIILEVNNKQLISGLQQSINQVRNFEGSVSKSTNAIGTSFKKLGVLVAGLGIGKILKDSITSGMNSIESENRFQVLFQGYSNEVRKWSEDMQKALGVSAYSSRNAASNFYELATAQGIGASTAKDMAMQLTQIGYDIASFKDKDISQVFNAMQSAFVGNTEALRSMGYVVTADMVKQEAYKKGIAAVGTQLTQTQKAAATYSLIMQQASSANGDLARTLNSPSNQLRILREQLSNLKTELGMAFMPIVQVVLPILNTFIGKLIQVVKTIGYFMQALFGKPMVSGGSSDTGIGQATVDIGNLANGYENAETAAKKAKKALMGFDELNTLAPKEEDIGDSVGGGGSIEIPEIPEMPEIDTGGLDEIPPKIQAIADKIKDIFGKVKEVFIDIVDFLNRHKEIIISIIGGIVAGFAAFKTLTFLSTLPALFASIGTALSVLSTPIGIASVIIGVLAGMFIYLWQTSETFRDRITAVWDEVAAKFSEVWNKSIKPFVDMLYNEFLIPLGEGFKKYIVPVFEELLVGITEVLGRILVGVLDFVGKVLDGIRKIWDETLQPFCAWFMDTFGPAIDRVLQFVIESFRNSFKWIGEVIDGVFRILGGLIDFIVGVFTLDWEQAWNGIKDVFGGVWDILVSTFSYVWDQMKNIVGTSFDIIKSIIKAAIDIIVGWWEWFAEKLVNLTSFIWDKTKEIWGAIVDFVKSAASGVKDFIVNVWTTLKDWITTCWNGIKDIILSVWTIIKDSVTKTVDAIKTVIVTVWTNIKDSITSIINSIKTTITTVWNGIKDTLTNVTNNIKSSLTTAWTSVKTSVVNIVTGIKDGVVNKFNEIKTGISNVVSYISGGFKTAWNNAWTGIANIFKNIWNGLTNFVKAPLNFIIDMVNKVIGGLNKLQIPDWVPYFGGSGVNLPYIPRLAQGGIIDKPTTAVVGEAGPEVVMPLKNTPFVKTLANAVGNAVASTMSAMVENQNTGGEQAQQVVLNIDGVQLAKAVVNNTNRLTKITGECAIRI